MPTTMIMANYPEYFCFHYLAYTVLPYEHKKKKKKRRKKEIKIF
jgi:hypothetical protein